MPGARAGHLGSRIGPPSPSRLVPNELFPFRSLDFPIYEMG